ncbi:bifunctional diaminohydroxyphosphoribosylaminopyrimidine deaminase/5-amino-6-(5-phosphoribosylamino)uracil reductase RibD [Nocardioides sp. TF02-7]|uniref:bifunctional diaminohydroxyphosphoribosylaminopyrimidine deaminase/5-amino-6-(5-phosphoribosylamino)uracil reductase RibD n=1 Tax=Nocardioides sp. TF02-7 TaxID=2917724 RepID=UPI001F0674EA|nr:bifunctional diaminohydroxyphosphoribosylaminopyrimidine deaminase/5-amino-6-(5-phosphoribosylamino)uracil reductase RibD [Nocardioides sp. TF02-7]UMG92608.1 bifunctional diaminohydroxyphosphoribosylaminopyrimidine deaminase/5-amino-6-(5-phosphoribosylamino)uracil reductase RibD [Nocardioides sp. TF02-7]
MVESFTREYDAMHRALRIAAAPGVPLLPNPRVGCVLLGPDGEVVGEGHHRGAGTPHAEVEALRAAGDRARGATAVVTLEPCNHTGRTGPCVAALVDAGVTRVVVAQRDPNPVAGGGLEALAAAGVAVEAGLLVDEARALNRAWTFAHENGRPFVTWKLATTIDGRSAAADGSSRWVSSAAARRDTHVLRALCDAILVGTGTVEVDDPLLTVRDDHDQPLPHQPLRAVVGERELAPDRRVLDDTAPTVQLHTRDPRAALAALRRDHERHHVLLEGGPTLAAAFLQAGVVDEVVAYVAPMLLGAGRNAVGDLGIGTIAEALRLRITGVAVVGEGDEANVRVVMEPRPTGSHGEGR